MINKQARTRPSKVPRQRASASKRPRRIGGILVVGAGVWVLLALFGWANTWTTVLVLSAAALLVAIRLTSGRPARRRRSTRRSEESEPEAERSTPRLNATSEDFNTLAPTKPQAPPSPPKPRPVMELPRRTAPPAQTLKMPPPVPPPLAGRPGSRPVLAGYPLSQPAPPPAAPEALVEVPAAAEVPVPKPIVEAEAPVEAPVAVEPPPRLAPLPPQSVTFDSTPEPPAPAPQPVPVAPAVALAPRPYIAPVRVEPVRVEPVRVEPVEAAPSDGYTLPSFNMLPMPKTNRGLSDDEILERAGLLERTLKSFGVEAKVIDFAFGPAVTRYELQPAPGVRVNKFTSLADDLALALAAEDIRIEAPIPGKSAVGIEVPNRERLAVPLREVLESPQFRANPSKLAVAFGKDNAGNAVVGDLARMPHLLIAGSTGSGKSVCMNTIISSLLFKARPDEVKMLMIDPKMVELSTYNGVPHLTAPVVTDVKKAAGYLKGAVKEMEARYELFAALGVRNIQHYNQLVAADPGPDPEHPRQPLPYIVIFIDELADLMMVASADVEDSICRLAQMARACGMHLVIATQSPRVDVITGLIKANVPSRIAFAVSSQIDSRVVMDAAGAERLLGRGDMLYHPSGLPKPIRAQGAFIDEESVEQLVRFVKAQARPTFTAQEVPVEPGQRKGAKAGDDTAPASAADAVFPQAVRVVIEHGQASVSILQRRLRCNYSKATRLIDMMEERGFIGPHQGSRPRDVLMSMAQWREMFGDAETEEADETEE